jgi:hypothetical protein
MNLFENFFKFEWLDIFFKDLSVGLGLVAILVVIFWLLDKIQSKPDLTTRLAKQEQWQKRFKK